jgi:hypothetical protein
MDAGADIELSDMVSYVISQIQTAHQRAASQYTLSLDECTIEMNVTVTREGGAGIKAYVVEIGGSMAAERVHKVTVQFRPYKPGDPDQTAMLAGQSEAGQQTSAAILE